VLGCQQHLCHADDVGLADDDEAQILDAVRQILSDLDLSAAVTVTQDRTSEFNLGPDERDVFIEPVISGPAPIAIHLDGGSIIYFTAGECGTVEWFLDKEIERSRVIEELVAVIEGILRYGLEEHVRAGWWRVGATTFIPTTDGPKKLGYVNSWRKDEIPGTHVIRYPSYVGHSEP
jgi:hypothetical protein